MLDIKDKNYFLNKKIFQNLENIIKKKLYVNGYIFFGPEGLGKQQTALRFIGEIFNQFSPNSNNNEKIINNNHPDFLLIEPTYLLKGNVTKKSESELPKKNLGEIIRIEQIRNIKTFLSQKSIESGKKIVLIKDAHLLNEAASNCLLKTLEEPSNGIFILITPKKDLLLKTIISRCQLIRFNPFSLNELKIFFEKYADASISEIHKILNFQDLVNFSDGSPEKLLNNFKTWSKFPSEIKEKLEFPLKDYLEILKISKYISVELEIDQQILLINFLQLIWWKKTKNEIIIKKLESLKKHLKNYIQPRLAWEVILLEIAMKNLDPL